jgi:hypothetical protein
MGEGEGQGQGEGASSLKYRPSAAAQLRLLESESEGLPEASNTVVSQLFKSVAPPASSSKIKSVKGTNLFSTGMGASSSSSSSSPSQLVVKKSAVLQPVSAESGSKPSSSSSSSQSILEKSKAGTKSSASKLGKISPQDAIFAKLSLPEESVSSSAILKGKSKAKKGSEDKDK